ncbi:MAG: DUF1080 domain-containing protein [Phycisphaeraceae bacterium]|nr:DUF1080 domain-containing protein [Phycisphaeraceae bacterium]
MHPLAARLCLCALSLLFSPAIAAPQPAKAPPRAEFDPGVTLRVYQLQGNISSIPRLVENQTPNFDELRSVIDFPHDAFPPIPAPILTHVLGYLFIPEPPPAGERAALGDAPWAYRFRLISDDGSRLLINNALVIDHDGRHGATPRDSAPIELAPGRHTLFIEHFDSGGQRALRLEWQPPGARTFSLIPTSNLTTQADLARVTSPGVKAIITATPRRPGDGRPLDGVHPGMRLETFQIEGFEPRVGAMAFSHDGRLIIGTFDPLQRTEESLPDIDSKIPDRLYAISGITADPSTATLSIAADGLYEPCGLVAVGDALYVSHRHAITRLTDTDGDGFYETHHTIASGWEGWNYHQFHFGLVHKDGKLFSALATAMAPPKWEGMGTNAAPNGPMRGGILEIDLSSNTANLIAGGTRTPNGLGLGPNGDLFYCDNQGTWMPANQFSHVVPGRFYGHFNNTNFVPNLASRYPRGGAASAWCDLPRTPATLLLSQGEVSNSPTQPILIEQGPYAGHMLIGELTAGGLRRACLEKINGQWQGAVFRFTQGLNCGVNRVAWGPDGALYVGGIGAGGNWNWRDTRFGLQRLVPNGQTAFELFAVRALPDGFELEFTRPIDPAWLANPAHYAVSHWTYAPTAAYGGPKVDQQSLRVSHAVPNSNGIRVTLTIPGLREGYCVHIRTDPTSLAGETIWSTEAWYTLNHIPRALTATTLAGKPITPDALGVGVLPPEHAATLIGRSERAAFTTPRSAGERPTLTRTQNELRDSPGYAELHQAQGDLTSRTHFADFRLHVEWYCPPGGEGQLAANSGVFLHGLYELQVLGTLPGSTPLKADQAGAIYNLKPADLNASTGPGTWQAYDIWFRAPRFENGAQTQPARITAYWNGHLIHHDVPILMPTGSAASKPVTAPPGGSGPSIGPLRLQAHASAAQGPVRFRNVWIAPIEPVPTNPGDWVELFDGSSLDGWFVRGGEAAFAVDAGEIIGITRPNTPNTFLVSERVFNDFELLLEVKHDHRLNSGVQFRSSLEPNTTERSARVVGYQYELDPSPRAYSGGIYDESRRGWLAPLIDAPYARDAYRPGDWNIVRILARGPLIQTWINGVPASTILDCTQARGHIALQVHGVGKTEEPLEARFRRIRVRSMNLQP